MAGIPLGGANFTRGAAIPLDDTYVQVDLTARDAIVSGVRYEGMPVFVVSEAKEYRLQGGITNGDWVESGGGGGAIANVISDTFNGTGSQTIFTLTSDPGSITNTHVFIDGVYQAKATYSISTTTLTFTEAPPTGTGNIQVNYGVALAAGTPSDGSVTDVKLSTGAVTTTKILDGAVTLEKLSSANFGLSLSSGNYLTTSTTYVDVTNLSVTLNISGNRPVQISLQPSGASADCYISTERISGTGASSYFAILENGSVVAENRIQAVANGNGSNLIRTMFPPGSLNFEYEPTGSGSVTFKIQVKSDNASDTTRASNVKLYVRET